MLPTRSRSLMVNVVSIMLLYLLVHVNVCSLTPSFECISHEHEAVKGDDEVNMDPIVDQSVEGRFLRLNLACKYYYCALCVVYG